MEYPGLSLHSLPQEAYLLNLRHVAIMKKDDASFRVRGDRIVVRGRDFGAKLFGFRYQLCDKIVRFVKVT